MIATKMEQKAIRAWLKGMGWSCCFLDYAFERGEKCEVFHPAYGKGSIEYFDGAVDLVRPGGVLGDFLSFEHTLTYYDDGSYDTDIDEDKPFPPAIREDVAIDIVERDTPVYDCSDEVFQRSCEQQRLAYSGSPLYWDKRKRALIPEEERIDERDIETLDRLMHSPRGRRFLRRCLLVKK
jgi:hypothetical protein